MVYLILVFSLLFPHLVRAETEQKKSDRNEVAIPAGDLKPFWIRPKDSKGKQEPIHVEKFSIMAYPVTNEDFRKFVQRYPDYRKSRIRRLFADGSYLEQFSTDLKLKKKVRGRAPVTYVSWFAARAYCEDLGMRLPTTVEWEYVAAANEQKADATSDSEFLRQILEWYGMPKVEDGLAEVGARKPNFYGIYDLHRLVWEWVDDFNSNAITGESRTDGTVNRDLFCGAGGLNGGNKENYAAFMRFAFRASLKGASVTWNLGFRCVRETTHESSIH